MEAEAANNPAVIKKPAVGKKTAAQKKTVAQKSAVKRKAAAKSYARTKSKSKTRRTAARPITRPLTGQEIENQQQVLESVNAISKPEQMTRLWATAQTFLNVPYKLGSNTLQGTDCSGYTSTVYKEMGVAIPRTANQQFLIGSTVAKEALALGDLVFFGPSKNYASHVGLYIGEGKFMHASTGSRRVRIDNLTPMLGNRRYLGAKRILPEVPSSSTPEEPPVLSFTEALEASAEQAQLPDFK